MKQRELKKIKMVSIYDCWDDFDLSNKSIYDRILKNKVVVAETIIKEVKRYYAADGIYDTNDITPDFDAKKFDYSEKYRNKKFQKFCYYFREYIEFWMSNSEIESPSLKSYIR